MRIELLQLPKKPAKHPADDTWQRFFDFASVTNNPHCFYDTDVEARFARLGAWEEAKAAVLMALANKLLPGRVDPQELRMVAEGRRSDDDALRTLGLAIHSGTTRSIQRALVVALDRARAYTKTKHPTLLTADFEYPGIVTAIDEIWDGPVFVARLKSRLCGQSGTIPELFARAVRTVRPDVIYISHVDRYTGFVFPWDVLTKIAGKGDEPPIVIVDGAQAAGNIDLSACFELKTGEGPHVYAASAHKFLCALPTLGLLIALRDDVRKWELEDKAVAYSFGHGARGTGSIESMASLARSLYGVLGDSYSMRDEFLAGLQDSDWKVVQHDAEHGSGLFQISTENSCVALRLERLLRRQSGSVGYHIASLSGTETFLDRGIHRRNERIYLNVHHGDWHFEHTWREDITGMEAKAEVRQSYRVSIHPSLHKQQDVEQLCEFLKDPRSWRDRAATSFEDVLAKSLQANDELWGRLIRQNVEFLLADRFPDGTWGASYHATCQPLIVREKFPSSGRDRSWREGGVANSYYALRGLRSHLNNVEQIEREVAKHWTERIGDLRRIIGVRSATRPNWLQERWRHAFFAYLACIESEEETASSPLKHIRQGQENAIRQWVRDDVTARPDVELAFSGDDWLFGGLCVLHRVLRDLQPDSRAEDLVMQRLGEQLVAGAGDLSSAPTPHQFGPIFLSSAHAFSTLVDGRILDGPVQRDKVIDAIKRLGRHVMALMSPHPRFTEDGQPSISAAFAGLSFFMWPWMEEVWQDDPEEKAQLLKTVETIIDWIQEKWEDESAFNDIWSEFHGSFLALDVVRARNIKLGDAEQAILNSDHPWMLAIRKKCESGRPANTPYDPAKDPRIFDLTIGSRTK